MDLSHDIRFSLPICIHCYDNLRIKFLLHNVYISFQTCCVSSYKISLEEQHSEGADKQGSWECVITNGEVLCGIGLSYMTSVKTNQPGSVSRVQDCRMYVGIEGSTRSRILRMSNVQGAQNAKISTSFAF